MQIKFDLDLIRGDKTLNDLSWEVIEARGVEAGDLVKLWDVAIDMAQTCAASYITSADFVHLAADAEDFEEMTSLAHVAHTYDLLAKFLARDAREIIKFLDSRGFKFPDEYIGKLE